MPSAAKVTFEVVRELSPFIIGEVTFEDLKHFLKSTVVVQVFQGPTSNKRQTTPLKEETTLITLSAERLLKTIL